MKAKIEKSLFFVGIFFVDSNWEKPVFLLRQKHLNCKGFEQLVSKCIFNVSNENSGAKYGTGSEITEKTSKQQQGWSSVSFKPFPVSIYLFKVITKNTRKRCEICSKFTIKTPELRHWYRTGVVFLVNFEHTSHLFAMLTLNK